MKLSLIIEHLHAGGEEGMINGTMLMQGLVVFYVIVAIVFGFEGNWAKCTYWIGASIITSSVLVMK